MISSIGTSSGRVRRCLRPAIALWSCGRKYSSPRISDGGSATVAGRSSFSSAPSSSHRSCRPETAESCVIA
jgi:hypothetical protein